MDEITIKRLLVVHAAAKKATVSYSLHYEESDDSFCFSVRSAAPKENWDGRSYSFGSAVDCVLAWLNHLNRETT